MDKEKIKSLMIAGYKGAKLGLSQEELMELVEITLPNLIPYSQ
ncbi:MAG: hypothetical protein WC501_02230 [Candidatus Micrarchaeia archaeon]